LNIASTKTAPSGPTCAKTADVTVVGGAGHVGVTLVPAFAEAGLMVNVNDLNESTLATLRSRKLPFIEHSAASLPARALASNRLLLTGKPWPMCGAFSRMRMLCTEHGTAYRYRHARL
jgi:UDP-N-acetyl-D-mannosaminuronic acid dehydrogenase